MKTIELEDDELAFIVACISIEAFNGIIFNSEQFSDRAVRMAEKKIDRFRDQTDELFSDISKVDKLAVKLGLTKFVE